jgi:hypothetical protein
MSGLEKDAALQDLAELASSTWAGPIRRMALDAARAAVSDPFWVVRDTATEMLGDFGSPRDRAALRELLRDPHWVVRAAAAGSLGCLGAPKDKSLLLDTLRHDSVITVRRHAALALAELGDAAIIASLLSAKARTRSPRLRAAIVHALLVLDQKEFAVPYIKLLSSDDFLIVDNVLTALAVLFEDKPWLAEHASLTASLAGSVVREATSADTVYRAKSLLAVIEALR